MNDLPEMDWTSEDQQHLSNLIAAENLLALRAFDQLTAATTARIKPWSGREQRADEPGFTVDQLISLEFARSTRTFGAVLHLCREGYGHQAAMLNRSLFEGMAVAHWIEAKPAEAQAQSEQSLRFGSHLAAALVDDLGWADDVDEEKLAGARLEGDALKAMKDRFGRYGQWLWTGHRNLPALLREIEEEWDDGGDQLWLFYKVVNRENNQQLHSTMIGLTSAFNRHVEGGANLWIGPSNVYISETLFGAYWTYGQTLTLVAERFELNDREAIGTLISDNEFAFHPFDESTADDLGRNDPCPCNSSRKYKDCHLEQVETVRRIKRTS